MITELVQLSVARGVLETSPLVASAKATVLLDSVPLDKLGLVSVAFPERFDVPIWWRLAF